MEIKRRKTRQIKVGDVKIGAGEPVSIQSMTKTDTANVNATVKQIKELESAGCEIVRVAIPNIEAAFAIKLIKRKIKIPIVADIHFNYKFALCAINSGADKIRLNPGNINKREEIAEVVKAAKKRKIPIRIGANSGSIESVRSIIHSHQPLANSRRYNVVDDMIEGVLEYIKIFEDLNFRDIVISLKASNVLETIEAYKKMSKRANYPLHLGVTAAGLDRDGIIKSSIGIGSLLLEGIGDTMRVSLTSEPAEEVRVAQDILQSLGLRRFRTELISCPTCGRCEVDLIGITKKISYALNNSAHSVRQKSGRQSTGAPEHQKIAVMGCIVNGPGEAADSDIGIAAGKGSAVLFRHGKIVKKIKESEIVKTLLGELCAGQNI